jgi:hypothetical protein
MENEKELQKSKPIVRCEEFIREGENVKTIVVEYDLSPVSEFIEMDGIDSLISTLREIQFQYSTLALSAYENCKGDVDNEIQMQLHLLKMMAECFEIIRNGSYQLKEWSVKSNH